MNRAGSPLRARMKRAFLFLIAFFALGSGAAMAATGPALLDKKGIHELYGDGEFDLALAKIESFTRANSVYPKDDSIFIAKHLAVIYSANPTTREQGTREMFRLLELLPSAKIVDMFVSDEIARIFEKVREEYAVRLNMMGRNAQAAMASDKYAKDREAVSPVKETSARIEPSGSRAVYWIAGGAVLAVGAGALVYLMLPGEPDKNYDIPR